MPNERLPVNIFPGVLPGSYLFLDNGEDSSKWANGGHPLATLPFDNITEGESSGYFGKGVHSTITRVAAIETNGMYRSYISPPSVSFNLGATVRMNSFCYPRPGLNRHCRANIYPIFSNGGSSLFYFNLRIQTAYIEYMGGGGVNGIATVQVVGTGTASGQAVYFPITLESPWLRVFAHYNGSVVDRIEINGRATAVSIAPIAVDFATMWGQATYLVISLEKQFNVDPAGDQTLDIDQLWLSDTENIV